MNILELLEEDVLQEKYFELSRKGYEIVVNPSTSDMRRIKKEGLMNGFRIIIDVKEKNVYLFNSQMLHDEAAMEIFHRKIRANDPNYLNGYVGEEGSIAFIKNVPKSVSKKEYKEIKKWVSEKSKLTWRKEA